MNPHGYLPLRRLVWRLQGGRRRWMGMVTGSWERKRFYRHVSVYRCEESGRYGIKLDHRNLRTPLQQLFLVPFEPLALLAAQEWDGQVGVVNPSLMHVTSMCNTLLDNPRLETRDTLTEELGAFLESDTLRARSSQPDTLVAMQEKEWDPVINWFNKRFGVRVAAYTSLLPPTVPPSSLATVMPFIREMNRWSFTGFEVCVEACKSLILSCAVFEGRLGPEAAAELARLEVRYQTGQWGEVEWQHGVDQADLRARITAGLAMHQLTL
ncbi:ATP synthase mitochondrial F1 complex assembly factor 2-like isoform X2 [Halichondria panicea]|uniref:ATP synthase mitochondrial F1 complex assembly factor 2-like isoform X2 n=1 Tax=Halichondria panicea TaxID=6063 RepID=UPI00312B846C